MHFFTVYKELEHGKRTMVHEIRGRAAAREAIARGIVAYEKEFPGEAK
jgi:inorganic pyrophosphatase